jgi:predicted HTH domain antitoxin
MISQDKAAEIAGLSRYEFLRLLAQYDVSAIQYTPELLDEELTYARRS